MQVAEAAEQDWAKAEKIETLCDVSSIRRRRGSGTCISRTRERWKEKAHPVPFALAEYNDGRRVSNAGSPPRYVRTRTRLPA